jgi:hypothetical protein
MLNNNTDDDSAPKGSLEANSAGCVDSLEITLHFESWFRKLEFLKSQPQRGR